MPSECPVCHVNAVETETGGEHVCHQCGTVVESRVFTCENDSRSGWTQMRSDGSARFDGRYELSQSMRQRLPTATSSRSTRLLKEELFTLVRRMNLPADILNEARGLLFDTVKPKMKSKEMRGLPKSRGLLVASCVYIVCRQNSIAMTFRSMSQKAECNMFHLAKTVKIILRAVGIHLEPMSLSGLVSIVFSQLLVFDESCETLALELLEIFKDATILRGANKVLCAAALVVLILEFKRMSPSEETFSEVLGKNSLTEHEVKQKVSQLKGDLLELAKQVPWIAKSVTKKTILWHIQDIVNFHKNCQKLDNQMVKSKALKRKEMEKQQRVDKIKKAKHRILVSEQKGQNSCPGRIDVDSQPSPVSFMKCTLTTNSASSCQEGCHGEDSFPQAPRETMRFGSCHAKVNSTSVSCQEPTVKEPETEHIPSLDCDHGKNCGSPSTCDAEFDLDDLDIVIEKLLRSGYSEEELMDGYYESRLCELQSAKLLDVENDRKQLDEADISEEDMHQYLFPITEVEKLKNLRES